MKNVIQYREKLDQSHLTSRPSGTIHPTGLFGKSHCWTKTITSSVLGNRVKVAQDMPRGLGSMASPEVQAGTYETPTASELHRLMWTKKGGNNRMDEVYPRIYIGDMWDLTACLICICYEWCNNESSKIIHRISQNLYIQICLFIILAFVAFTCSVQTGKG